MIKYAISRVLSGDLAMALGEPSIAQEKVKYKNLTYVSNTDKRVKGLFQNKDMSASLVSLAQVERLGSNPNGVLGNVLMMEDNPGEAVANNIDGTRIIADLAVKYGTKKFVMISTDKAVNPTNVMGCSKRICEMYCQSLNQAIKEGKVQGVTQFVTTRFGNVLGSNGSVIPLFKEQIRNGGPLTVTHPDIIRYFMLIPEACKLVLQAGSMGEGGEIYVFDMGKPVKIADLAKRMIRLSGAVDVEIKYTGLRDGEKLYEELLNKEENTKPSSHPKIKLAAVRELGYDEVCTQINKLVDVTKSGYNDMDIVRQMKVIVPEFKSKHSKYEALD